MGSAWGCVCLPTRPGTFFSSSSILVFSFKALEWFCLGGWAVLGTVSVSLLGLFGVTKLYRDMLVCGERRGSWCSLLCIVCLSPQ